MGSLDRNLVLRGADIHETLVLLRPCGLPAEDTVDDGVVTEEGVVIRGTTVVVEVRDKEGVNARGREGILELRLPSSVRAAGAERLGTTVEGADEGTIVVVVVRRVVLVLLEEGKESGGLVQDGHVEREEKLEVVRRCGIEEHLDGRRGPCGGSVLHIECERIETKGLRILHILDGFVGTAQATDLGNESQVSV